MDDTTQKAVMAARSAAAAGWARPPHRLIEGLASGADGIQYAVTHPEDAAGNVRYLIPIDPHTFRHESPGSLGFGASCLGDDVLFVR